MLTRSAGWHPGCRGEPGESLATVQRFNIPLTQATTSSLEARKRVKAFCRKAGARKATLRGPAVSVNSPSSLIRILPSATTEWAWSTAILVS